MAVLADNDRAGVTAELIRALSRVREPVGAVGKADLRAVVNALDDFLNTNAIAINNAIPQPARGALTTAQKARILAAVILERWAKGA